MLWGLDTCACEFEVDWDEAGKQNILRRVVKDCGVHGNLPPQDLFDAARENNGRKNDAWKILEANSKLTADDFNSVWSFDGTRVLHVALSRFNVDDATKASLQAKLASALGEKIVVD